MGGRQNYKKKRNKNRTPQETASVPAPIEAQADRLSRGDSYTLLALLVGVFFVLIVPTLPIKVVLLAFVCSGFLWFATKSHWTHSWSRGKQTLAGIACVVILCSVSVPQLLEQWHSKHAGSHVSDLSAVPAAAPVPVSSTPTPTVKRTRSTPPKKAPAPTPVPIVIQTPTPTPTPTAIARIIQTPTPKPTPIPTPPPKPCHGDNLRDCEDEPLVQWGQPLAEKVKRITDQFSLEMKMSNEFTGNKSIKAFEAAEKNAADSYRDCCAEDTLKYYKELCARIGGGSKLQSLSDWTQQLLQPINSSAWKKARENGGDMMININYELGAAMRQLQLNIDLRKIRNGR
jgi:hypothetical protein